MAEALIRKHGGGFNVYSAGMDPSVIHPLTVRVMKEVGLSLEGRHSKGVREFLGRLTVHHLIIVCERTQRECPKLFPGALNSHFWPFPDPAAVEGSLATKLAAFREVRDGIEDQVLNWVRNLDFRS